MEEMKVLAGPVMDPAPTALEIAQGDRTTVPEGEAWVHLQQLEGGGAHLDLPFGTGEKTWREVHRERLGSYVRERREYGHALFPEESARANRERAAWHRDLFLKPLEEVLPPENAARLAQRARLARDPVRYQERAVLKSYMNDIFDTEIRAEDFDHVRNEYARQHLGLKEDTSDRAVFAALKDRTGKEDEAERFLGAGIGTLQQATLAGLAGRSVDPEMEEAGLVPGADGWGKMSYRPRVEQPRAVNPAEEWMKVRDRIPAHMQEPAREIYLRGYREARRTARRLKPVIDELERSVKFQIDYAREQTIEGYTTGWEEAAELVPDGSQDRQIVLSMLSKRMESWRPDDRSLAERSVSAAFRSAKEMGRGFFGSARGQGELLMRDLTGVPLVGTLFEDEADRREEIGRKRAKMVALRDMVYGQGGSLVNPWDNTLQRGALIVAASVPQTAAYVLPGGYTFAALSYSGQHYDRATAATPDGAPLRGVGNHAADTTELRRRQLAMGLVHGTVAAKVEQWTTLAGVRWLRGKFPTLAGAMNRAGIANPMARAVIGAGATGAAIIGTETAEEMAQGASENFTRDLALRLSGMQPQTDWQDFFTGFSPRTQSGRDMLAAASIFALVGAGGASFSHFHYGEHLRKSSEMLRGIGVPEARIREIVRGSDVAQSDRALRRAFRDGLEKRAAEQKLEAVQDMEAVQQMWAEAGTGSVTAEYDPVQDKEVHVFTPPGGEAARRYESREDALLAWRGWGLEQGEQALDLVQDASSASAVDFLTGEGAASRGTGILREDVEPSLADSVFRGYATVAQMSARLEAFALQAGARVEDVEADFGKLRIRARRYSERMRDGSLRHVVQLFKGHDPLNVIEDLAEDAWVRALEQKLVTPEQLVGWVREAEAATGNAYLERGYAHDAAEPMKLLEALSAISREYALDRIHAGEGFPALLKEWLDLIVGMTAAVFGTAREVALRLGRGAKLRRAFEGGALPAEFLAQVEDSIGLNAEARERRSREGDGSYEEGSTSGEVETDVFADLSPDTTFSIEPSSPERDARPLPELGIPDLALQGDWGSLRRAVRELIASQLQGKTVSNRDTGKSIRFNSESKRESVSKVRKEPAFRAAMEIRAIAEEAVRIGWVAAGKDKAATTERLDYYALPLRLDGKRVYAWFNTRVPHGGSEAVFYEFGVYEKKETQALQRPWVPSPVPGASRLESEGTIGEFLAEIKETLPAAVKVAADLSMSLAPLGPSVLDALRSDFSKPAETYNFEHYDEIRPRILDIAAERGVRLTRLAVSHHLPAGARRLGEALGIEILFYEGGDPREGGFTSKANPEFVFLNCRPARRGVPVSWTLSHEILHVAQKDGRAKAGDLDEAIRELIGPEELEAIDRELEARGYAKESYATERPAFLTGDAISGLSLFGLDSLSRAGEIRKLIEHYFSELGVLSPESLAQVDDRELARNYDGSRSSPEPGSTFALAPLGPGPREIREAPRLLERKENPFSNSAAKTPKEWRAEWSGWIKAHRQEWEGEGPVELPEGPVVIGIQARDHVKQIADGENPSRHFEAAARMRELLENSELVDVQAPREYEKAASEIHRRYAWMVFADGVPRNVLLTVKRWDDSRNTDTDSMYALEALEVTEPGVLQVGERAPISENHPSISPGSGDSLARFVAGIKPEHRWRGEAAQDHDSAGPGLKWESGHSFSIGGGVTPLEAFERVEARKFAQPKLADSSPRGALTYWKEHIEGRTFRLPKGLVFTARPGHFFRFVAGGFDKGMTKASSPEEALGRIASGDFTESDIRGYERGRAEQLQRLAEILESPDFVVEEPHAAGKPTFHIIRKIDERKLVLSLGYEAMEGQFAPQSFGLRGISGLKKMAGRVSLPTPALDSGTIKGEAQDTTAAGDIDILSGESRQGAGPDQGMKGHESGQEVSERHGKRLRNAMGLGSGASHEQKKTLTGLIVERINRKSRERNPVAEKGGPLMKGIKRPELFSEQLQLTPEERMILHAPYEIVVIYTPDGRLKGALTAYDPHYGPAVSPDGAGHRASHQHPRGLPPSFRDLVWLLEGNPEQVLRIVAPQKDGSVDLYQLWVEGDMLQDEALYALRIFRKFVDQRPDTKEVRLEALALTVGASSGKLQFRQRRLE